MRNRVSGANCLRALADMLEARTDEESRDRKLPNAVFERVARRSQASGTIAEYRAKFAIEKCHECALHDDVIFAIIDGAPLLPNGERSNLIVDIMRHVEAVFTMHGVTKT